VRLAALLLCGCLGPQVSDTPGASGDIVPAGTVIPAIDGDDAEAIIAHEFVAGVVPRISAFAAGAPLHVWDFGPAPQFAAPEYVMMRRQPNGTLQRIAHDPIVGIIPGDPNYTPYWQQFALVVTDRYQDELVTSTTAIEEAIRDGLIEAPVAQTNATDCPIVSADVRLDVGTATPAPPSGSFYYEHHTVSYFDFGPMPLANEVDVPTASRYVLSRQGEPPLSEPLRGVDIDGDGDIQDTNDVYERAATDAMRSPLCRTVNVTVVATIASIDTSQNDAMAQIDNATQLFDPAPSASVVAYTSTDDLRNCPAQRMAGGL